MAETVTFVFGGHSRRVAIERSAGLRGDTFFRAPLAGIVCMHRDLGPADAVSVGMFLQTLLLALTERGLGNCVEVSVAGYPEIVRAQLAIPAELSILCGLAVGYPDPDFPANRLHIGRSPSRRTWCSSKTNPVGIRTDRGNDHDASAALVGHH